MDGETIGSAEANAVDIPDDIADRLVQSIAMQQTPERLVHNAQILAIGLKSVLLRCEENTEVDDVPQDRQGHQSQTYPE